MKIQAVWRNAISRLRKASFISHHRHWPNIVSKKDINNLRLLAGQAVPTQLDHKLDVHHRMLGESLSPFAKNGFEFAETRLYQQGDNVRFINWRRYASTGQLFVNTFHEERRPQCWIVLDRRASMRFGTRVRLKVAQAAHLALYNIFKAKHQQSEVGGLILDESSYWYEAKPANTGFQPLIQHIISPCPPIVDELNDLLSQNLRVLAARLTPGSLIVIISDFIDLQQADINTLNALAGQHTVSTLHIVDPIEKNLPHRGQFKILNTDHSVVHLNCEQSYTRTEIQERMQKKLDHIEKKLKQSQAVYRQVDSHIDLLQE